MVPDRDIDSESLLLERGYTPEHGFGRQRPIPCKAPLFSVISLSCLVFRFLPGGADGSKSPGISMYDSVFVISPFFFLSFSFFLG